MKLAGGGGGRNLTRNVSFQSSLFVKHRSAPLSTLNLNKYVNNNLSSCSSSISSGSREDTMTTNNSNISHLNEISTNINNDNTNMMTRRIGDNEDDHDNVSKIEDLESLLFGSCGGGEVGNEQPPRSNEQHTIIKQSLEIDATCKNLIGDRSKQHVLPVITSAKHTDLYCISPETVKICIYPYFRRLFIFQ